MQGFYSQILNIDLTARTSDIQPIETRIYETYLGGKGLATLGPPFTSLSLPA